MKFLKVEEWASKQTFSWLIPVWSLEPTTGLEHYNRKFPLFDKVHKNMRNTCDTWTKDNLSDDDVRTMMEKTFFLTSQIYLTRLKFKAIPNPNKVSNKLILNSQIQLLIKVLLQCFGCGLFIRWYIFLVWTMKIIISIQHWIEIILMERWTDHFWYH